MRPALLLAVRLALGGVAAVSGVLLLIRVFAGPGPLIHNPIGAECAFAVSVLLVGLLRSGEDVAAGRAPCAPWHLTLVAVAAAGASAPVLSMPLVTDDYIHVRQVATEARTPFGCLSPACGAGSQFFRPLGIFTFWAEWQLWGGAALPRHAFDVLLHAACAVLFLMLLRHLEIPPPLDLATALLFAWHGATAETLAWSAARFDTLALLFSLIAALGLLRSTGGGFLIATAATAAACLSKESAFVLPLLLLVLRRRAIPLVSLRAAALVGPAAAVFAWRWAVLHGIGGYVNATSGSPQVLDLNAVTLGKTFFARIWGLLWFPLNWSVAFEWWMQFAFMAGLGAAAFFWKARPGRAFSAALAGVAIACIPAHHLLLIGESLERSRYLTLATVPFVIAMALAARSLPRLAGIAGMALLAVFQLAALEHNLGVWRSVAARRYETCGEVAALAKSQPVAISDLPILVDGVYWRNGFEECLWLDFGVPLGRVRVGGAAASGGEVQLRWDTASGRLVPDKALSTSPH